MSIIWSSTIDHVMILTGPTPTTFLRCSANACPKFKISLHNNSNELALPLLMNGNHISLSLSYSLTHSFYKKVYVQDKLCLQRTCKSLQFFCHVQWYIICRDTNDFWAFTALLLKLDERTFWNIQYSGNILVYHHYYACIYAYRTTVMPNAA